MLTRIREFVEVYRDELFFIISAILIFATGFGAGRLTVGQGTGVADLTVKSTPISAEELTEAMQGKREIAEAAQVQTNIVGNKNSRVFHLSTCSGARSMAEQNKVYFASIDEAVAAGYRAAANCPGL